MEKSCFKCSKLLPLECFYKHPMMADGHLNKCKECAKRDVRANRTEKSDYYQAYDRVRYADHGYRGTPSREAQRAGAKRWESRNREKRSAHAAVGNAVRDGRLVRPSNCSRCGVSCTPDGHHPDYSKPLEVVWLCEPCHGAEHRRYDWDRDRELLERRRQIMRAIRS